MMNIDCQEKMMKIKSYLNEYYIVVSHSVFGIQFVTTIKPYSDHPWDPNIVSVVDKSSLLRCTFLTLLISENEPKNQYCCRQVVVIWRGSLARD